MVKLKSIKKNNSLIECDIFPGDSLKSGHIVVDIVSAEVQEYSLPEGYEWCINHINHAKNKLIELSTENNIPKEKLVMWY